MDFCLSDFTVPLFFSLNYPGKFMINVNGLIYILCCVYNDGLVTEFCN